MIQFNLLPDVKLDYIKAERTKRTIAAISVIASLAAIALLVILLAVVMFQKKHLNDLSHDIKSEVSSLQNKPNIGTVLTVQNQLESLTQLHNKKPSANQLFTYLNQVTPANVSITNLSIDFTKNTITITGTADSLSSVNKYVDTLKSTTYTVTNGSSSTKAFNSVVLTAFGLNTGSKDQSQAANYTISLSYDPTIFDNTQTVTLNVPNVTTRAQVQNPSDLFKAPVSSTKGGQ